LNIILKVETDLKPNKLLKICKNIEKKLGRKTRLKNSPRECDIDIIDFKSKKMKGSLNLPHPSMHLRNFVLLPLFEINKTWRHPILKLDIKKLILSLPNNDIRSIKQI
jgi:2-amino-4-hydroxy-6-hydroxymethyldihydropteridine diphosphokinase